ncbi:MAG: periplasmic heavy metal sensor [Deltaproteobacteria bacterium]|nr:periplasmic heavy metal sensor [Deltaproteobacteria bacterium]
MSEPTDTPAPESTPKNGRCHGHCRAGHHGQHGKRRGLRRLFGVAFLVGGMVAIPTAIAYAGGHGFGGHGCGHHDAPQSAEDVREHMEKGKGFILGKIDATPEQEARVDAVLDRLAPELFALKDDKESLRDDLRAALTAENVDAAEVESIRKEGLGLADEASRIVLGGVVEIAQALSPDQRAELAEAAQKFHR